MAKEGELSTDWERSAGDFTCVVCRRKRLPASEFSKKQVEKALESLKTIPDKDIRTGPEVQHIAYVSATCKKCVAEQEELEREKAQAKRAEREQAAEEAVIEAPELVHVTLEAKPFGLTAVKTGEGCQGYTIAKAGEGKPAARAGVRPGWRLVEVAGTACRDLDMEATSALLKEVAAPAELVFEAVPRGADFCTACQRILASPLFSRKMRTKPVDKRRCTACVEAAEAEDGPAADAAEGGAEAADVPAKPKSKLSELQSLCAESAKQAEAVTGLRAARGAGRGGKGRGRGYR